MEKETKIDGEKGGLTLIMHCGKHSGHQLMSVSTEVIPPPTPQPSCHHERKIPPPTPSPPPLNVNGIAYRIF